MCDGLPWVSQHFVPVISSKTLSIRPGVTHADHLIVSDPVGRETHVNTHSDAHNEAVQHKNQDHAEQENDHFTDLNTITNLLKDLGLVL